MSDATREPGMVKETITKPDGRYLIFYTWPAAPDAPDDAEAPPEKITLDVSTGDRRS